MSDEDQYNGFLCITVKTLHGRTAVVQTWGHRTVMQFKVIMSRLWGLVAEDVHLIFEQEEMENERTLGSYMSQDSTVILVLRLNSGFF